MTEHIINKNKTSFAPSVDNIDELSIEQQISMELLATLKLSLNVQMSILNEIKAINEKLKPSNNEISNKPIVNLQKNTQNTTSNNIQTDNVSLINKIKNKLGNELSQIIKFAVIPEGLKIYPEGYINNREHYQTYSAICKEFGGTYQRSGKSPYFLIPSKLIDKPTSPITNNNINQASNIPINPIERIQTELGDELFNMLDVKMDSENIIFVPKHFIGSENFGKISSLIRKYDGSVDIVSGKAFFKVSINKIK